MIRFLSAALVAAGLSLSSASAATLDFFFNETATGVTVTGVGAFDLSGPSGTPIFINDRQVNASIPYVALLDGTTVQYVIRTDTFETLGNGGTRSAGASSGDSFSVGFQDASFTFNGQFFQNAFANIRVPVGYVSNAPLRGSIDFPNATFASLGLNPINVTNSFDTNTVNYLFGEAPPAPAAIPLPAALPMLLAGLAGLGLVARRRA